MKLKSKKLDLISYTTNSVRLLHPESQTMTFMDSWLLTLKEVMVDEGHGAIIYQQSPQQPPSIAVDEAFLGTLEELYLRGAARRFSSGGGRRTKQIEFITAHSGFLADYLDIRIPGMVDYVLILDHLQKHRTPGQFAGGFAAWFPLLELYETHDPDLLICRFQLPEPRYAKLATRLFLHLREVCLPQLYVLAEDFRNFKIAEKWQDKVWESF
jgi:hypothetical protein